MIYLLPVVSSTTCNLPPPMLPAACGALAAPQPHATYLYLPSYPPLSIPPHHLPPQARELQFNQGVDAAAGLVTRLQQQRRACVRLLAIWEEIVEMQQQASYWARNSGAAAAATGGAPSPHPSSKLRTLFGALPSYHPCGHGR